jgi:hypothetical protein
LTRVRVFHAAVGLLLVLDAGPAVAQDGVVGRVREYVEQLGIADRLNPDEGLYPRLGGLATGSGLALGVGYRAPGWWIPIDVSGSLSTKLYNAVDARARWAALFGGRLELWTTFNWHDYTQEEYFGLGQESSLGNRANYGIRAGDVSAIAIVPLTPWLHVGGEIGHYKSEIYDGQNKGVPTLSALFAESDAPGQSAQPTFIHNGMFVDIDFRDIPGNPHQGGHWLVSATAWDDKTLQQFNYARFIVDGTQFIPLVSTRHLLALHVDVSSTISPPGNHVPFYALPYLGGGDTLRGFEEYRFHDSNALYFNVEYRYDITPYIEAAAFVDAGEVMHTWGDARLARLRHSFGGGLRMKSAKHVIARLDVGTGGGEGTLAYFKFGKSY